MRRKDGERDRDFGLQVIDAAEYGVLSLNDEAGKVYSLPLSFARDGEALYIHGATAGRRAELFAEPVEVRIVFVSHVKVPPIDTAAGAANEEKIRRNLGNAFTTEFSSAIVTGMLQPCAGEERIHGLRVICEKFTPDRMDYFDAAVAQFISFTNVYRVDIHEVTAKAKKIAPFKEWR